MDKDVQTGLARFSAIFGFGFNALSIAGGTALALTSGPFGVAVGSAVAAIAAYRTVIGVQTYRDIEKNVAELHGKSVRETQAAMSEKYNIPKFFTHPAFTAASSLLTVVAGVALFGTVGPLASLVAVAMVGMGGLGVLGSGLNYLATGPMAGKFEKIIKEAEEKQTPGIAPYTPDFRAKPVADEFKAAANENAPEAKPTRPDARPKPPQFG